MKKFYKTAKILRLYPGLCSEKVIRFKGVSFQKLEKSLPQKKLKQEIKQRLESFKLGSLDRNQKEYTLADIPMMTTVNEFINFDSYKSFITPYESVLFFLANLDLDHTANQEKITFYILDKGGWFLSFDKNSLRINNFDPKQLLLYPHKFEFNKKRLSSELLKIFTSMNKEVYDPILNNGVPIIGNQLLINSLYWFNKGSLMSDLDQEKSAIIFFATAFESFFNIKNRFKKESLGYAVQRYLGDNGRLRRWMNDFYDTRNKIVHGSYVENNELKALKGSNVVHSIIAIRVLRECILRQLHITDGLDYSRAEMDDNFNYIVEDLLTLNQDKINKLKNRKKFSYVTLRTDEVVTKDFFRTLASINPIEEIDAQFSEINRKNYHELTRNLAKIAVDWINDVKVNGNLPIFRASINKDKTGIDGRNYDDELSKIIALLKNYNPKGANDIFITWNKALKHFDLLYSDVRPHFLSRYKGFDLYDILGFVRKTAISLG